MDYFYFFVAESGYCTIVSTAVYSASRCSKQRSDSATHYTGEYWVATGQLKVKVKVLTRVKVNTRVNVKARVKVGVSQDQGQGQSRG